MQRAKYYIYRNLRTGGFSIRFRGKVIVHAYTLIAENVEFKVNELGRQRVLKERQKNVHAFIVADKYEVKKYPYLTRGQIRILDEIDYNPYKGSCFNCNGKRITEAKRIATQNGVCFLVEK